MKQQPLSTALTAAILIAVGPALAHDNSVHVAQNTELKQFGGAEGPRPMQRGADVPLWKNLLGHRFATATSQEAQAYIDQGIMLNFGFNHAEAVRSFRRA